jgi:hypothetical protein
MLIDGIKHQNIGTDYSYDIYTISRFFIRYNERKGYDLVNEDLMTLLKEIKAPENIKVSFHDLPLQMRLPGER